MFLSKKNPKNKQIIRFDTVELIKKPFFCRSHRTDGIAIEKAKPPRMCRDLTILLRDKRAFWKKF